MGNIRNSRNDFDLVVIGGGINGAGVAREASLRGLKVCLVEKGDFGSGASSGCFRIIHGGLRYLQHLNLKRLLESVTEQRNLRILAPHQVSPLSFLIPCYGFGKRSPIFLGLGVLIYQLITFWKNNEVGESNKLGSPGFVSKKNLLKDFPLINKKGLKGAIKYFDCQLFNCERFSYSVVHSAKEAGAEINNYTEATGFNLEDGRIKSVRVRDLLNGELRTIKTKFVVNASGPWVEEVLSLATENKSKNVFSKGVQAVLATKLSESAIAFESNQQDNSAILSRGGRSYFLVPWRGHSLLGTTDTIYEGNPDDFEITDSDKNTLLEIVKTSAGDVEALSYFGGLRPVDEKVLEISKEGDAIVSKEDKIVSYENQGLSNLISLVGAKYTTFRSFSIRAVDKVVEDFEFKGKNYREVPLYGGDIKSLDSLERQVKAVFEFDDKLVYRLARDYGSKAIEIARLAKEQPELAEVICEKTGVIRAEVVFVLNNENVKQLEDVIYRRVPLSVFGEPTDRARQKVKDLVSEHLGEASLTIDKSLKSTTYSY